MAGNTKTAAAVRTAMLDILGAAADTGYLRIYDGTQPTDADTAIGTQVLLAELRFGADAFPPSVSGVLTANAITGAVAGAAGAATWFRVLQTDGTTALWDGSVGTSNADMVLNTTAIAFGATVAITALTYTLAA
jgi:hypothetical protein